MGLINFLTFMTWCSFTRVYKYVLFYNFICLIFQDIKYVTQSPVPKTNLHLDKSSVQNMTIRCTKESSLKNGNLILIKVGLNNCTHLKKILIQINIFRGSV